MIRDKRAKLVITVEDIIEEYTELKLKKREDFEFLDISNLKNKMKLTIENEGINISKSMDISKDLSKNKSKDIHKNINKEIGEKIDEDIGKGISKENIEIYNAIIEGAETIDEIARKTNKDSKEVACKLTILELENAIEALPGKRFKIKKQK